jgi:hypothetical protein
LYELAQPIDQEIAPFFGGGQDFELALEAVRNGAGQLPAHQVKRYDEQIRLAFLSALTKGHPDSSARLSLKEVDNCAKFLEHFVGTRLGYKMRGRVYTTNYDLLLYWVVVRTVRKLVCYDSHENEGLWNPERPPQLVYLHGALHLFPSPTPQRKLEYKLRNPLLQQIKHELYSNRFPSIVAEGTTKEKLTRITESKYLSKMRRHFRNDMRAGENAVLFIYGHSLSERDAHILEQIGEGNVCVVCIGAFGGINVHEEKLRYWASIWSEARRARNVETPEIWVYDTAQFSPWQ